MDSNQEQNEGDILIDKNPFEYGETASIKRVITIINLFFFNSHKTRGKK